MLLKSTVLLVLASFVSAGAIPTFFEHTNEQGRRVVCEVDINQCYHVPEHIRNIGLSSFNFNHNYVTLRSWTVQLFSGGGANCAGNYDGFSFTQGIFDSRPTVASFPTVNDQVYAFKIYNHKSSNIAGGFISQAEDTKTPSCTVYN
ncbi:hypothetical protein EC991_009116 [Linnemannia zychae]|nr:hypothetical protein EC991_009116 [Linnemannia zychae]